MNQGFGHPNSGVPRLSPPHRSPYVAAKAFFAENGMHAILNVRKGGKNDSIKWTIQPLQALEYFRRCTHFSYYR
jgi:hypothetical protein